MSKFVVDIGNRGYQENSLSPLKPFAELPLAARPLSGQVAEMSNFSAPSEAVVFGGAGSRCAQQPLSTVVAAAAADFSCAARSPSRGRDGKLRELLAERADSGLA